MDKEKEKGNVDSKFRLLNFPKQPEEEDLQEYRVNVVFSSGKTIVVFCCGFVPMSDLGSGFIGFWSEHSQDMHTIINFNQVEFIDIEKSEV
tara:strand:- start:59 stop:331 length:273 start_codon:yes stop_codon:yes gene_type:complete